MERVLGCAALAWRGALADLGGEVVGCDLTSDGLEIRARIGVGLAGRPFIARWFLDSGMLCEGERADILAFTAACASHGFAFRLDQMALCG